MSKERLEDKLVKFRQHLALGYVNMDILNQAHEIHELVMEQAERAQELEEFNRILSSDKSMFIEELVREQQQNKRYREALGFYADRDNYKLEHFDPNLDDYMSTVDYDEGQKARQTIGSEKIND